MSKTITSVPKTIRKDVKSLLKHGNEFQVAVIYVDINTGTIGTALNATEGLAGLIDQAVSNYADITRALNEAFEAGQNSVKA
jgi:hypothetical protein